MTSSAERYEAKDFAHAISVAMNMSNQSAIVKRKELGENIFKHIPKERIAEYFIALINHISQNPNFKILIVKSDLTLLHVLVQSFFAWLLHLKFLGKNSKKKNGKAGPMDSEEQTTLDAESEIKPDLKPNPNAIVFTNEQQAEVLETLAKMEFPVTVKVLHLALKGLNASPEMVVSIVKKLADEGKASFSSLIIILSEPIFNKISLWPELLLQCLLMGAVTASQVESFAAGLKEDQREKTRADLLYAEKLAQSHAEYTQAYVKFTHRDSSEQLAFDIFRNNIINLMADMRHRSRGRSQIDNSVACGLIRHAIGRRYVKNEINNEQLLDLIGNILKQSGSLKSFTVKTLQKHNDSGMISRIKHLDVSRIDKIPFADVDLYEVRDNFLALPKNVRVNIVNKIAQLPVVLKEIDDAIKSDYPYVGLDAEWSPFLTKPRASVLQLAFRQIIYIVDMDSMSGAPELSKFLDYLFGNEKLCKIGFRFTEDLTQLRGCAVNCLSLYQPKNLICIQTLFFDLISTCHNKAMGLETLLIPSKEPFLPSPEIAELEAELADPDFDETDIIRTRGKVAELIEGYKERDKIRRSEQETDIATNQIKCMGLANVCARVLGKKLDKSEQCSAWDRRPLRKSQVRYAALDAYCILMILDKFIDYCKSKNIDISLLIKQQGPMVFPLPLFFAVS